MTAGTHIIARFYVDQGIAALGLTVDKDASRYALQGICLRQSLGADPLNKYVMFTSSDGRRATNITYPQDEWCYCPADSELVLWPEFITCVTASERKQITSYPRYSKSSKIWSRISVYSNGEILRECGFTLNGVNGTSFVVCSNKIPGQVLEGRYPRLDHVLGGVKVTDLTCISVDAEFLIDACKQVLAMNQASDPDNKHYAKSVILAIDRTHMTQDGMASSLRTGCPLRVISNGKNTNLTAVMMPLDHIAGPDKLSHISEFERNYSYDFRLMSRIASNPLVHSNEATNEELAKIQKSHESKSAKKSKASKAEKPAEPEPAIDPPVTISTAPPEVASPAPEVFPDGYLYTDAPEEFDNPGTSTVQVVGCDDLNNGKLVRLVKIENANDHRWLGQIERYSGAGGGRYYVADTEEKFATMTRPNGVWKLAEELAVA